MTVPKMWQDAAENGTIQKLAGIMDTPPMGLLGVSACNDEEQWKYFIAVSSTKAAMSLKNIPCLRLLGQSFLEQVQTSPYRNWSSGL